MKSNEELLSELMDNAGSGKHTQFQFIRSWQQYLNIKRQYRGQVLLVSSIEASAKKLFKNYCRDVAEGKTKIVNLIAYQAVNKVLLFYREELEIIRDMIYEYDAYLLDSNLLNAAIFKEYRPAAECYDRRGKE